MREGKAKYLNRGFIRGSIMYIESQRNYLRFLVITDGAREKAELWVIAFDTALLDGMRAGDLIELDCHIEIRVVIKLNKEKNEKKKYHEQRIIADSARLAKRALYYDAPEYLLDDVFNGGHPRDENSFQAAGILMNVYSPNDTMSIATIKTADGNRNNLLNTACYRRQNDFVKGLEKNVSVVVTGSVINGTVRPDGSKSEMFYCRDIARTYLEEDG